VAKLAGRVAQAVNCAADSAASHVVKTSDVFRFGVYWQLLLDLGCTINDACVAHVHGECWAQQRVGGWLVFVYGAQTLCSRATQGRKAAEF
jgi:hypothetical protein